MIERAYNGDDMERRAGILCPMFSVPANQGIGDFGQKTVRMIDCIADAGYHIWQILPLQAKGKSHSPYYTLSSFAGDPIYINLDRLCEMGLLTQSSITNCNKFKDQVDYETVRKFKEEYFKRAFKAFKKNFESFREEFEYFEQSAFWLEDWAVYELFRSLNEGIPWTEWDKEFRDYPIHRDYDFYEYEDELFYTKFLQFIFYKQLDDIVMYAHAREITIISDVAFTNFDSADVWASRTDFMLNELGLPKTIAISIKNFEYQMPIHDFKKQQNDEFSFWRKRIKWISRCFDMAKVDYFRVFNDYLNLIKNTTIIDKKWFEQAIYELVEIVKKEYPEFELIVEGLEKLDLNLDFDVYDMDVLLDRMHVRSLKKDFKGRSVVYTGNQNYETVNQAYYGFDNNRRISLRRFFRKLGYNYRNFNDMICRYALDSCADLCILPIWDVCGYKEEARIYDPDRNNDENWTWKLKDFKVFPNELLKTREWIEKADRL